MTAAKLRAWRDNEHPREAQMHRHLTRRCLEDGDDCDYCEEE